MKTKNIVLGLGILAVLLIGIFFLYNNRAPITGDFIFEDSIYGNPDKLTIYFFWGEGCPHCVAQKPFLESLEERYGEKIEIKSFETWKNPENVKIFQEVANAYGMKPRGVPTTYIGEKNWVGYSDHMAGEMEDYVKHCIDNLCENPLKGSGN